MVIDHLSEIVGFAIGKKSRDLGSNKTYWTFLWNVDKISYKGIA